MPPSPHAGPSAGAGGTRVAALPSEEGVAPSPLIVSLLPVTHFGVKPGEGDVTVCCCPVASARGAGGCDGLLPGG